MIPRKRLTRWVLALCVPIATASACAEPPTPTPTFDVTDVLGGEPDSGYARVVAPRPFVFPEDHGPHPAYKTEWWYVTANLEGDGGNRFGVQFTIFRSALAPPREESVETPAAWSSPQVYMAHVALTDEGSGAFHAEERFSREAVGLAGASAAPFRVWLEDWRMASVEPTGESIFPVRVQAALEGAEIDLYLDAGKPVALQGDRGFSPKGEGVGDASHYYSFTRLAASGRLTIGDTTADVVGTAWLDREWSTSVLGRDQTGWDWFAVQLADGRDLMVFELRSDDTPVRDGILVDADGSTTRLSAGDFEIEVLGEWVSPATGARYPSGWRIVVDEADLDLVVVPLLEDQEHVGAFRYWEGAVRVSAADALAGALAGAPTGDLAGTGASARASAGTPLGVGYVELTGYARAEEGREEPPLD